MNQSSLVLGAVAVLSAGALPLERWGVGSQWAALCASWM